MLKRILVVIALLLLPAVALAAWQWNGAAVTAWNGSAVTALNGVTTGIGGGGGGCAAGTYFSQSTINTTISVGDDAIRGYIGNVADSWELNQNLCSVEVYVNGKYGTTKSWQVEVKSYNTSTGELIATLGTSSSIAVGSITIDGFNTFSFASPVTGLYHNVNGIAVFITPSDHTASATEYLDIALATDLATSNPYYGGWNFSGAYTISSETTQANMKFHASN